MSESQTFISPADSAKFIAERSKYVKIKDEGVSKLASELVSYMETGKLNDFAYGDDGLHPTPKDLNAVDWLFVIDTLNFCFWSLTDSKKWAVEGHTGYYALTAALRRAIKSGYDITDPKIYSKITEDKLREILKSDDGATEVSLIPTRLKCLHEVGDKLLQKFDGSFENCIKLANKSAVALLKIVVDEFPCFRDEGVFENQRVTFYKRAQILVCDIWSCLEGKGMGEFHDINKLTMFADYRVPQVLVHFGVLEYDQDLTSRMKQDEILENDSREVMELRGCSIHAVELVNAKVEDLIKNMDTKLTKNVLNSALIDYFLWLYRRKYAKELEHIPFNKVICHYY